MAAGSGVWLSGLLVSILAMADVTIKAWASSVEEQCHLPCWGALWMSFRPSFVTRVNQAIAVLASLFSPISATSLTAHCRVLQYCIPNGSFFAEILWSNILIPSLS